jgi:DNA repair protein RadC
MNQHFAIAKEELSFYGTENCSLQNLLAVIIGPKANPNVTGQLASLGLKGICSLSKEELLSFDGIGETIANRIIACLGLAYMMNKHKIENQYIVNSPEAAAKYLADLAFLDQEQLEVLFLNTKNVIIGRKTIFKGTLNACFISPREIYKEALKVNACSIIVAHQHPSGDPTPSQEDKEVTKKLAEAGKIVGINLNDHIIIGQSGRYTSLKEMGVIYYE